MALQQTLAMIKPDGVEKGIIGEIVTRIEAANLKIVALRMHQLTAKKAEGFYAVHREKPFFKDLVTFMSSGPSVAMVLEGEGAIASWRDVMGATDPAKATAGTLRADFGTDIQQNVVHGSDAPQTAAFEVSYFFEPSDIVSYEWV